MQAKALLCSQSGRSCGKSCGLQRSQQTLRRRDKLIEGRNAIRESTALIGVIGWATRSISRKNWTRRTRRPPRPSPSLTRSSQFDLIPRAMIGGYFNGAWDVPGTTRNSTMFRLASMVRYLKALQRSVMHEASKYCRTQPNGASFLTWAV
jgi:hypothetical protein